MNFDYHLEAARTDLENKLKARYEAGSGKPSLCELHWETPTGRKKNKLQWMYNAGQGSIGFGSASSDHLVAANELLKRGTLVKTFTDSYYDKRFTHIKHFDDVNFGLEGNGGIIIFELVKWLPEPDMPDLIIRPDEKYDAVINNLRTRMSYDPSIGRVLVDETPLQLNGGPLVRPIITDPSRVRIMMRQSGLDV